MLRALIVALLLAAVPSPWPQAPILPPGSAPHIVRVWLSSTQIVPGVDWSGRVATSTNVASLEIRTESFSFNATRTTYGQFSFDQHILDIVPQYKRHYTLLIIARNAAGIQDVRRVPIDIR
jgi:hypothetical protein